METTASASAAASQLMKQINASVNGTEEQKANSLSLSKEMMLKMADEPAMLYNPTQNPAGMVPVGRASVGDGGAYQAEGAVAATILVAEQLVEDLNDSGCTSEAEQVDNWRSAINEMSLKWTRELEKTLLQSAQIETQLRAEDRHTEANGMSKLTLLLAALSSSQPQGTTAAENRANGTEARGGSEENKQKASVSSKGEAFHSQVTVPVPVPVVDEAKMPLAAIAASKVAASLQAAGCAEAETVIEWQRLTLELQASGEDVEQAAHDAHELALQLQSAGKEQQAEEVEALAKLLDDAVICPPVAAADDEHVVVDKLAANAEGSLPQGDNQTEVENLRQQVMSAQYCRLCTIILS